MKLQTYGIAFLMKIRYMRSLYYGVRERKDVKLNDYKIIEWKDIINITDLIEV